MLNGEADVRAVIAFLEPGSASWLDHMKQIPADEPIPGTPVWHQWKEAKQKGLALPSFVRLDQFPGWEAANGKSISGTCWHFEKWPGEKTDERERW